MFTINTNQRLPQVIKTEADKRGVRLKKKRVVRMIGNLEGMP